MSNVKVKALKAFSCLSSGKWVSVAHGAVAEVDSSVASDLISDGLAESYTLVTPTGNVNITSTDSVDVSSYATAQVVDSNLVAGNIKKDVTILGVTGTYE